MYLLERVSLHNWYLLEGRDIDLSGSVALIGQTGAGKSAVVDAIQTALSGNNRNVIRLNRAAGEMADRRVLDYCLGCVTDVNGGKPTRPRAETIIALSFLDPATGDRVALGVLLVADEEETGGERTPHRFVIRGAGFRLADFIDKDASDRFVPPHEVLVGRMRQRFGTRRNGITFHATSIAFVQEYLTAMRPRNPPDPRRFLTSLSNALAAKEISDPTDFVRRFVLEANPLNVKRVRESIATWRELQAEAKRLEEMLRAARNVRSRFVTWARQRAELAAAEFTAVLCDRLRAEIEIRDHERGLAAFQEKERELTNNEAELEGYVARLREENERDAMLGAQSDERGRALALEAAAKEARRAREGVQTQLLQILGPYLRAAQLDKVRSHLPTRLHGAVQAALDLGELVRSGRPGEWAKQWATLGSVLRRVTPLSGAADSLRQQLAAATTDLARLREDAAGVDAQLKAAGDTGGTVLSPQTVGFRAELRRRGIEAIPLPDVVEVSEERWAFALEALLGPYREALIIPADQVAEAFRLLHRDRNRFDGCRLVDTRRTRGAGRSLPRGSIAEVADTDHPDARAFIAAQVGRTVRAEDEGELARLDHGIMPDGKTTQGVGLRVFRDRRPILGRTAQAAALQDARERREGLREQILDLERRSALMDSALGLLAGLSAAEPAETVEAAGRELHDALLRGEALEREREELSGRSGGMTEARNERNAAIREQEETLKELRREARGVAGSIESLRTKILERQGQAARLVVREADIADAQNGPREARALALAEAEAIPLVRERLANRLGIEWLGREAAALGREAEEARRRASDLSRTVVENVRRAGGLLTNYLAEVERGNPLPEDADDLDKLFWIDSRVARIEAHELMPHRLRVEEARTEMERMLKEDLLARLDERLQGVRRQLDILNRRLAGSGHTFVGQTYAFRARSHDRLRPLAELARHVAANPQIDFAALEGSDLTPALRAALADVERIVGSDEDVAEIEDYRRYFEFELMLRRGDEEPVAFSKILGKLSGGQRQAPYYVAIAASMVSVYYPGNRTGDADGMGLVLFDEAFNKLDVANTQALLALFRSLGLQVVVAAPEASRPTFLETVDTLVTVARQPGTADVYLEAARPGPRARAAMRAANPEHLGVEGFRAASPRVPPEPALGD